MLTWNPKSFLLWYCSIVLMVTLHPACSTPINETSLKTNESVKAWRPGNLFARPAPVTTSYQKPLLIFIPQMPSAGEATGFISFHSDTLPGEHSKNFMSVLPVVHNAPIPYPTVYPNKPGPTENVESVLLTESLPPESPVLPSQSSKPDDDYELYEELLSPEDIEQDPLPPSLAFEEEIPKKVNS